MRFLMGIGNISLSPCGLSLMISTSISFFHSARSFKYWQSRLRESFLPVFLTILEASRSRAFFLSMKHNLIHVNDAVVIRVQI